MNYFDYINGITPPIEAKEKIKNAVKAELLGEKQRKSRKNRALIGLAACLVIFVGTFTAIKISANKSYVDDGVSTGAENNAEDLLTITENDDSKSLPQEIVINNVYYCQYCSSNLKEQLKTDNGNILISESEIGDFICTLNENNIYNTDTKSLENTENAKANEFYNAAAYKFNSVNDLSTIIVKTTSDYYFFHAVNLDKAESFEKIIRLYSLDSSNKIDSIEVWQDRIVEETITGFDGKETVGETAEDVLKGVIDGEDKINNIYEILKSAKSVDYDDPDDIYFDIHGNEYNESMESTNQYRLIFNLSNGSSFEIWLCSESPYIQIFESTYFELDLNDVQKIVEIIK